MSPLPMGDREVVLVQVMPVNATESSSSEMINSKDKLTTEERTSRVICEPVGASRFEMDVNPQAPAEWRAEQEQHEQYLAKSGKVAQSKHEAFARSQAQASSGCREPVSAEAGSISTTVRLVSLLLAGLVLASVQVAHCDQSLLPEVAGSEPATTTTTPTPPAPTTELLLNADGTIGADPASNSSQAAHKIKPVNFTLVDELWDKALEEPEVARRWRHMDSQLQDGMKSILKMLFPQIVAISQDAKVSGDCSGGILKWILSLRNLRSWAIKMLDATGKPTAGMFEGSLTMFGNYRQCLSIRAPDEDEIEVTEQFEEYFRGQFCMIHLKPYMPIKRPFYHLNSTIDSLLRKNYKYYEKTLYDELAEIAIAFNFIDIRADLCVPSTCSVEDLQRVADLLSKKLEMRAKVMRCDIAPRETTLLHSLDQTSAIWALIALVLLLIPLMASILKGSSSSGGRLARVARSLSLGSAWCSRTQPMSATTSGLVARPLSESETREDANLADGDQVARPKPVALHGLRTLFVFWFILVQMTMELKYQYLRESLVLRNMLMTYWPFQIIINSTLLYESMILTTAFTLSYTNLELKLRELVNYALDKAVRLLLPIMALISLTILTPLLAIESPVWRNFVEQQSLVCKSTGYVNLFFLQNFLPFDKICLPHSWLLCVELQLAVLSIPLLLMLKRNYLTREDSFIIRGNTSASQSAGSLLILNLRELGRSKVGILGSLLVAAGFVANFVTVYTNDLPPSWFHTFPDPIHKNLYFGTYLTKTWTHLSVFLIGLLAGHLCRSTINLRNLRLLKGAKSSSSSSMPSSNLDSHAHLTANIQQRNSTMELEIRSDNNNNNNDNNNSKLSNSVFQVTSSIQQLQPDGQTAHDRRLAGPLLVVSALIAMFAIIFSTFSWSTQESPSPLVSALYDVGSRLTWSLALVFIVTKICLDYDAQKPQQNSWISNLLTHSNCIIVGRLSLLAYLLTPYVHTFVLAVAEQSLFPSLIIIFHVIVGNIVIIYTLAFILSILIEQPIRQFVGQFVLRNQALSRSFGLGQRNGLQVAS